MPRSMTESIPRPAARLDPRPPPPPLSGTLGRPSSGVGGPSIVIDTIFCPRVAQNQVRMFICLRRLSWR